MDKVTPSKAKLVHYYCRYLATKVADNWAKLAYCPTSTTKNALVSRLRKRILYESVKPLVFLLRQPPMKYKAANKIVAATSDCNALYCALEPRQGARIAIAEAPRNRTVPVPDPEIPPPMRTVPARDSPGGRLGFRGGLRSGSGRF